MLESVKNHNTYLELVSSREHGIGCTHPRTAPGISAPPKEDSEDVAEPLRGALAAAGAGEAPLDLGCLGRGLLAPFSMSLLLFSLTGERPRLTTLEEEELHTLPILASVNRGHQLTCKRWHGKHMASSALILAFLLQSVS